MLHVLMLEVFFSFQEHFVSYDDLVRYKTSFYTVHNNSFSLKFQQLSPHADLSTLPSRNHSL